ncbi:16S rRNA (uracil(1498)-N(3))-methyltransferase [Cumulibacter manganitolerans]|uniref:16S rRNA (uracil(1498)-N(3))-methyltransferase n=1 Tax=Cumulibacter manganitolerans TaxID=1884992 RepID=UPI0012955BC9|nr:16S rRNA (uracil(1498)-N(3))-methyltransferase [Cumulibacter manganitolerans]
MARASAYLPVFFGPLPEQGDLVQLTGDDGAHAVRVRRTRVGEQLRIADTYGRYADCEVLSLEGRSLTARILRRGAEPEPAPRILVAQALPKGDRGALAVELMTEAGVDEIIPWQSATCVARWADAAKAEKGRAKWSATAREAAKQSRRARVPVIADAVDTAGLARLVGERTAGRLALVLHESTSAPIAEAVAPARLAEAAEVLLVVGPEGGITTDEIAALEAAGATSVRLGPEVLRTSTAGVVAATWVASRTARWS